MRWFVICCMAVGILWYGAWGCSPTISGNETSAENTTEATSEAAGESVTGEKQTETSAEVVSEASGAEPTAEPGAEPTSEPGMESVPPEAGPEAAPEGGPEAAPEGGPEAAPEVAPELESEPIAEAGPEAVAESAPEGGGGSVPTNGADLLKYLQAGNYKNWPKESSVHGATLGSPHGAVRVYINNILDQSLSAGNTTHPVGAASVKELYLSDQTTLNGYAVMVKVSQGTGGQTWYWYERIGSNVVADGTNAGICTGCHSPGSDYFRTKYPLQ